jgi:hypothetical protein
MQHEGYLSVLQESGNAPYPEPAESNPHVRTLFHWHALEPTNCSCKYLQTAWRLVTTCSLVAEGGGSRLLWNVSKYLKYYFVVIPINIMNILLDVTPSTLVAMWNLLSASSALKVTAVDSSQTLLHTCRHDIIMKIKIYLFWDGTPCSFVETYQFFWGKCCLHSVLCNFR